MDQTGVCPDIMVLGKGITAGYMGLAATLATDNVFQAFYDDDPSKAFMHGPTFMGNPLACSVALKSIELIETQNVVERVKEIESILLKRLSNLSGPRLRGVRVFGAMACLEFEEGKHPERAQAFARENGVWLRPFGNVVYTMPPYCVTDAQLHQICDVLDTLAG